MLGKAHIGKKIFMGISFIHQILTQLLQNLYSMLIWYEYKLKKSLVIDKQNDWFHLFSLRGIVLILCMFSFSNVLIAQAWTKDFKYHNAGLVRLLVTNQGLLWPGDVSGPGLVNCEYPPNSNIEHIGEAGIWVAGITPDNDTLVSVTSSWNPWNKNREFYTTSAEWDSVWVIHQGDTTRKIPYWPGYKSFADQDFICRYSDDGPASMAVPNHSPLHVEVIQTSHAWSNTLLNEVVLFQYYVISKEYDLKGVYITYWADPNVGFRYSSLSEFLQDDRSLYYPDLHLGVGEDGPGGKDGIDGEYPAADPIGFQMFPRLANEHLAADEINWTFTYSDLSGPPGVTPSTDSEKYLELMATGTVTANQIRYSGSHFVISFGPYDLDKGDTLKFRVGVVLGEGLDGLLVNAERLQQLEKQDFHMPIPPPMPTIAVETSNHLARIIWEENKEVVETYQDEYRGDSAAVPFEGYRVYKSTYSVNGPWTLLAEYDLPENAFYQNIGLEYEYTDDGLLNNVDYYYTVTAFSKPDTVKHFPSNESSKNSNSKIVIPGTTSQETVGDVAVVPNPYIGSVDYSSYNPAWEKPPTGRPWMEQDRRLQFINLPAKCEIKIYTSSGDLVNTIKHDDIARGFEDWDMTSYVAQAIASGIYLFTVEDSNTGKIQVGKFVVIK